MVRSLKSVEVLGAPFSAMYSGEATSTKSWSPRRRAKVIGSDAKVQRICLIHEVPQGAKSIHELSQSVFIIVFLTQVNAGIELFHVTALILSSDKAINEIKRTL